MDYYEKGIEAGLITVLDESFDENYIDAVLKTSINSELVKNVSDTLKVVYTPLHGAGYKLVPEIFRRVGLKNLYTVDTQMTPDGNFPTVKKPNHEYADVFTDGIAIANEVGSDLVIATDPDSDRVGVMARGVDGSFKTINGNQMGALLLDYVITQKRELGILSDTAFAVKSIVSTDMAARIAEVHGIRLYDVLTGFKFIGEVIKNNEAEGNAEGFLLGFEESYGYLGGAYARDKDAVEASMLILEMTADYKKRGMTLIDALAALYKTYGYFAEGVADIYMEGLDGIEKRRRLMQSLRKTPPAAFGGRSVCRIGDYAAGYFTDLITGKREEIDLPSSDVLYFVLENEDKIIVRPSGTEPKVKFYFLAHGEDSALLSEKLSAYKKDALALVN
jgi:phosphoglucomutase